MAEATSIDGITPDRVVVPENEADIAAILRDTGDEDWVVPVGGGTALTTGNAFERVPVSMRLASLTGIREYEPTDLTVSVWAGMRWAELMEELGARGQTVPVDIPFPHSATVGGVVATGWAGPRRLRDGSLKDLLIGASFVRGDGLIAKAGGMVVKNVSGFEIPRLLHGSYGSLAVVTSVNLKVIPRHDAELTLLSSPTGHVPAVEQVLKLTRQEPSVAAAVVDGDGDTSRVAIRLTGREKPIRKLASSIRGAFNGDLVPDLEMTESERFWQERSDRLAAADDSSVYIEVGCAPSDIAETLRTLKERCSGATFSVSPGTGSLVVAFDPKELTATDWADRWRGSGLEVAARYMVLHAPSIWRSGVDIWAIPSEQRSLMSALKQQFDPQARLNRGRMWDVPLIPAAAGTGS